MKLKIILLLQIIFCSFLLSKTSASEKRIKASDFKIDAWYGSAYINDNNEIRCTVAVGYQKGTLIAFTRKNDGSLALMIKQDFWNLKSGANSKGAIYFIGGRQFDVLATAISNKVIAIPLSSRPEIYESFKAKQGFKLTIGDLNYSFVGMLTSSYAALTKLDECLLKSSKRGHREAIRREPELLSGILAIQFLNRFLKKFGLKNYKVERIKDDIILWESSDGNANAIALHKNKVGTTQYILKTSITGDAKKCLGSFASKVHDPFYHAGYTLTALRTACEKNGQILQMNYLLVTDDNKRLAYIILSGTNNSNYQHIIDKAKQKFEIISMPKKK